jgi:CBS-domain-containing membrane protein
MDYTGARRRIRRTAGLLGMTVANGFSTHASPEAGRQASDLAPESTARDAADTPADRPTDDSTTTEIRTAAIGVESRPVCASDVMTSPAPFVNVGVQLNQAARTIVGTNCATVAVIDHGGYLVDIVTEGSVANAFLTHLWAATVSQRDDRLVADLTSALADFTRPPDAVGLDTPLSDIVVTMLRSGLHTLPVVHCRRPVGVVRWHDILTCTAGVDDLADR